MTERCPPEFSVGNFPFRPSTPESRSAADAVLRSVAPMVRRQIRVLNHRELDPTTLEEVHADVMSRLWEKALPNFNSEHGAKVSTFLYRCAIRLIIDEFRSIASHFRHQPAPTPPDHLTAYAAPDCLLDERIEKLAADILRHPQEYMSPTYARVLRAHVDNPHMSVKDLSALLGYAHPRSLSTALANIRRVLADLEIEDGPETTEQPHTGHAPLEPFPATKDAAP